jgi:hypothetical protein
MNFFPINQVDAFEWDQCILSSGIPKLHIILWSSVMAPVAFIVSIL